MTQQSSDAPPRVDRGAATTVGGVQVFTSPDGRTTTITDRGKVTTVTSQSAQAPVVVTVDGRSVNGDHAVNDVIARVAAVGANARAPRESQFGFVRVNGRPLGEPQLLAAGAAIGSGVTLVAMSVVFLLTLAVRRVVRRAPAPVVATPNLAPQVGQLQHAVDAIAVEMERVSEAQRYSAKLLTERLPNGAAPNAPARAAHERVVTPH